MLLMTERHSGIVFRHFSWRAENRLTHDRGELAPAAGSECYYYERGRLAVDRYLVTTKNASLCHRRAAWHQ